MRSVDTVVIRPYEVRASNQINFTIDKLFIVFNNYEFFDSFFTLHHVSTVWLIFILYDIDLVSLIIDISIDWQINK